MNDKPTICQVLHSLNVGGAEVLAYRLARQLGDRFRYVFACLDDLGTLGAELRADGFVVEVLDRQPRFDPQCARRLRAFVRRQQVDLIHAHQYTPFFYSLVPSSLRSRPPVLFTEHGRWHPDYPRRKRILFNRLLLRGRDRVVAVGESVRGALILNEGIPAQRVKVIYNGVDAGQFATSIADRHAVRHELGLGDGDCVLIQVARLDALKDHGTAIRTMVRVAGNLPQARLLIVGEGPERSAIEHAISDRQMSSHVRLLGLRTDIARLLAAADLFLLTSVSEGIPVTLIEAMAAQLPVVATDVGGVPEVVEDGVTGLLAPSGDDEQLAAGVLNILRDLSRAAAMGRAGRERAQRVFSEKAMHEAYASLYEEMVSADSRSNRRFARSTA